MWNAFIKRRPAGFVPRALALAIDALLLLALSAPLLWLAHDGEAIATWTDTRPLSLFCNWLLPAVYFIGFWTWQGTTPGKAATGLRVLDMRSGERPGPLQNLLRWLGYFVSAAPLGLGFLWAKFDPSRQAWHDKIAGTRVVHNREADSAEDDSYVASHWRGEQSLARSFWVNNVLLSVPLTFALGGLMSWIATKGDSLQAVAIAVLIGWPLALATNTWCVIGAWRAAGRYLADGGSRLWGLLARISMGLGVLQIGASALFGFVPSAGEYLKMARGIDPIGQASFTLAADGRSLQLQGAIGMGDAARLAEIAATAPALRTIELASPGGRLAEAEKMVAVVRSRGATTRAIGNCESACTLVFLAGAKRQLMPGAQLGFHRASSGTYNPVFDELATQHLVKLYRGMGLPEDYVEKTTKTSPRSMWYPSAEDLAAHELILPPSRTLDAVLPAGDAAEVEYVDALRSNPAWFHVEQRSPGTIAAAAERMRAARLAGSGEDEAQTDGLRVLAAQMPALIVGSAPELRRRYIEILKAQMRADPARCQALLGGGLGLHRGLAPETLAAEAAWLIDASDAPAPRRAPQLAPTAVEQEVVRRSMRVPVQGLLAAVWAEPVGKPVRCDAALAVLNRVAALPAGQRELVERVLFQQPG
ncbi:RDD family protein [Paucibacter sp. R3-3]|uniref:RDD family protein n=1 Tax=Roseateles agri TaxID=3098619 RepID=A0ABU5DPS9_9BURK|nr:RDD family protein [Paucibacter sp. R3-3]MDY0748331.1 RDD family protein [Paucibacter sp. R3-3]